MVRQNGFDMVRLADAAAAKHCTEIARQLYQEVIGSLTGSAYEAVREEALLGLSRLSQG